MYILLFVICFFVIPLLAGLFMLSAFERNRFTWFAVLLTWKSLIATTLVWGLAIYIFLQHYRDAGHSLTDFEYSSSELSVIISPAILITLGLAAIFYTVILNSQVRIGAWSLLALDTVHWGNTFVFFDGVKFENGTADPQPVQIIFGIVMPIVFALVAAGFVKHYEAFEDSEKKRGE